MSSSVSLLIIHAKKMVNSNKKDLNSYDNLLLRLNDARQLLDSHSEILRKTNRRSSVALYRAIFVLICAHLEAFVEELYTETAHRLLDDYVWRVQDLIDQALSTFSNPQPYRINRLFVTIGFPNILKFVSWQGTNSKSVSKRLTGYVELRNSIAHGRSVSINKAKVVGFMKFVKLFSRNLQHWVNTFSAVTNLGLPARSSKKSSEENLESGYR